jgi:hypothetical protein
VVYADVFDRLDQTGVGPRSSLAGVYLPDLWTEAESRGADPVPCSRVPLALAYTSAGVSGHYTALVGTEGSPRALPLCNHVDGHPLTMRFAPPGVDVGPGATAAAKTAWLARAERFLVVGVVELAPAAASDPGDATSPDGAAVAVVSGAPATANEFMPPSVIQLRASAMASASSAQPATNR